jgi:hypothetical protein
MADLLIYWRDYQRNVGSYADSAERHWHSSSQWLAALEPGDRLWLVTAGRQVAAQQAGAAFLVEVWRVLAAIPNPGDDACYPVSRYRTRVLAERDPLWSPPAATSVDDLVRPLGSSETAPIGSLLQGPRRLKPDDVEQLELRLATKTRNATSVQTSRRLKTTPSRSGSPRDLDRNRIALGVRQPWVELILRGIKTIEVRNTGTQQLGPIYLYTSKVLAETPAALRAQRQHDVDVADLPRGRLVGSVEIVASRPCTPADAETACVPTSLLEGKFAWVLERPARLEEPVRPRFLPYGVWFYPFRRRTDAGGES